ncbi:MAG: EamA family transporter [Bradyrhizobium sp.]|nr:MAG: EamA family transporter [Bradyrhizobium sp.]
MTSAPSPALAPRAATLIGLGAIALWSSLALLVVLAGAIPPFELAALTFAIGGGLGFAYVAARDRLAALRQPWRVWAVGVGGLFGYHALYFAALSLAPPAEASLVNYLWPLLIVLLSGLLPGEGLRARHVIGAVLGFAGAASLFAGRAADAAGRPLTRGVVVGYALALAAAFVWSSYSVLSRRLKGAPTEAVAGFCIATAALATLCHYLFETTVAPAGAPQWAAIACLGVGPLGLAFFVWDYGVKHGDIRLLGIAAYATPVLSTLILIAGGVAEATASLGLACALIVGGAVVATRRS